MKILLAQINPVVGDIEENFLTIRNIILGAREKKINLVVFPELAITGYPPRDLLERRSFGKKSMEAVQQLAKLCAGNLRAVVGCVQPSEKTTGKPFHNSAALLGEGRICAVYQKMLLPAYDVFDETRWFEPGDTPAVFDIDGLSFGITICEDIWSNVLYGERRLYKFDPVTKAVSRGARFIINISSSPFTLKKDPIRRQVCRETAQRHGVPILLCNQVGGNDDLVFDGGSFAVDGKGNLAANAGYFEKDILEVELDESGRLKGKSEGSSTQEAEILWKALKLGIYDYVTKCRQQSVWLGLSGGIDSAVVAALAAEAIGSRNVTCISMPSRFSSESSSTDAQHLAQNLGVKLVNIPIEPVFSQFLDLLSPFFLDQPFDLTEENIQARCRGVLLMALSNKFGGLVLATGNKSETATGYCTLYGDMVGALAPIGDLYKTQVYALAKYINRNKEIIPESILDKAPTAELRPGQTDQDSLPPYDILDRVLEMYMEEGMDVESIVKQGIDEEEVIGIIRMLRNAEYKRTQAAIVLKVSDKAFGFGRRYPIAQNYREKPDKTPLIP